MADQSVQLELLSADEIIKAGMRLREVVTRTPLMPMVPLSEKFGCELMLKREDLQVVRSYKIRGAFNLISTLSQEDQQKGVVCASAGNHAQGVAFSCRKLDIEGKIFMPYTTPKQKVNKVKMFGQDKVEVILTGDTFDDCYNESVKYCQENGMTFVHPFDDHRVMEGQGTVGVEILEEAKDIDYIFVPIGGGGLASGVGSYIKKFSSHTKVIGVEPAGAPSMTEALAKGAPVKVENIDKFVDGAAVQQVGSNTFKICQYVVDDMVQVPEGKVCSTILDLYNEEAIVVEPAGALTVAALDLYRDQIKGKKVVCVVSGSNNDIDRMQEIKERSLIYEGLKHYFIVRFPQRAGALKEFVNEVLGPDDDITRFEYVKKTYRDQGPAIVGIELKRKDDYQKLIERMGKYGINYTVINEDPALFQYFI